MFAPTMRTFFAVHTEYDDDFVSAHTNKFLDGAYASSRELGEQDHAFDVVVFKLCTTSASVRFADGWTYELDIGTHFCDLAHLHHDEFVDFGVALFIVPHSC